MSLSFSALPFHDLDVIFNSPKTKRCCVRSMDTHRFVFPPPPPPPPLASPNYANPNNRVNGHNYGHNNRGNRGSRGSRGRGNDNLRRGPRGGNPGASSDSRYAPSNDNHFPPRDGFQPHSNSSSSGYPLPEYPPVQHPQYPGSAVNNYSHSIAAYPTTPAAPFPPNTHYHDNSQRNAQFYNGQPQSLPYAYNQPNQNSSYYPNERQHYAPRSENASHPVVMGPPIRIGFDHGYPGGQQQVQSQTQTFQQHMPSRSIQFPQDIRPQMMASFLPNSPIVVSSTRHDSPNQFSDHRSRGQRRHHDGPRGSQSFKAKPQAAPAVPSFGNPLPVKPPAPQEHGRKPKKKKRRHNQLGLTPKTQEHESSEEDENDADEEAKLAVVTGLPSSKCEQ